jgi:hypothetical protein
VLDSEVARREIQAELATPNPGTGLFHDFAAADVRLHPSRIPVSARAGPEDRAEKRAADEPSPEPVGAKAEEAAPVGPSRPEPGESSEGGVVGHIETASTPPLASVKAAPPDRSGIEGRRIERCREGVSLVPRGTSGARLHPLLSFLRE